MWWSERVREGEKRGSCGGAIEEKVREKRKKRRKVERGDGGEEEEEGRKEGVVMERDWRGSAVVERDRNSLLRSKRGGNVGEEKKRKNRQAILWCLLFWILRVLK